MTKEIYIVRTLCILYPTVLKQWLDRNSIIANNNMNTSEIQDDFWLVVNNYHINNNNGNSHYLV